MPRTSRSFKCRRGCRAPLTLLSTDLGAVEGTELTALVRTYECPSCARTYRSFEVPDISALRALFEFPDMVELALFVPATGERFRIRPDGSGAIGVESL